MEVLIGFVIVFGLGPAVVGLLIPKDATPGQEAVGGVLVVLLVLVVVFGGLALAITATS